MTESLDERQERLQKSLIFPGSGIIGWENGTPIPEPINVDINQLTHPTKEVLALHLKLFPSLSEARRNNFSGPLTVGQEIRRKNKPTIIITETKKGTNMPHLHYMKVKIKTLSEEARIIRKEEQKQMGWINFLCQKQSFRHGKDEPRPDERKWPEPKENAQEMSDAAYELFWGLREHRVQKLRREARINHLAYGFLRGVKYSEMEKGAYDFPKLKEIEATAKRFAADLGDNSFKYLWDKWVDEAKKHFEEAGNLNCKDKHPSQQAVSTTA